MLLHQLWWAGVVGGSPFFVVVPLGMTFLPTHVPLVMLMTYHVALKLHKPQIHGRPFSCLLFFFFIHCDTISMAILGTCHDIITLPYMKLTTDIVSPKVQAAEYFT